MFLQYRDGQLVQLQTPIEQFKDFKREFSSIVSTGFGGVFQAMPEESTIIVKFHLEFSESPGINIVDEGAIGRFVFLIQQVVEQTCGAAHDDLTCFVMTSNSVETDYGSYEDVYFQFPLVKSNIETMSSALVANLRHFLNVTRMHERLEILPSNPVESIISPDFYKQGVWPLPGSYIDNNLLSITHVFQKVTQEQIEEHVIPSFPPDAYFMNFQAPDGADYNIENSFYFANLNGFDASARRKKNQREKTQDNTMRLIEERGKEVKRTPLELASIFVNILSPERFAREVTRKKIGQVIFNVTKGHDDGLQLYKEICTQKLEALNRSFPTLESLAGQLGKTYQEMVLEYQQNPQRFPPLRIPDADLQDKIADLIDGCDEEWAFFEYTNATMGTLRYWAKLDNPDSYEAFIAKDVTTLAWKCLNPTASHTDVSRLVHAKYSDTTVCADISTNLWYGWWDNRWHELNKCHSLRIKISEDLPPIFEKILTEITTNFKKSVTDADKLKWEALGGFGSKLIKDLKTVNYKNNLVTECCERFYDPDFLSKLDEDRSLIGLPNGVYELETGIFREGKPEDFITLSTKAKYNPNYTWEHPRVKEFTYYMKTVYPDVEIRHYVQKAFATILEGGNMNKDFYNMIGEGDNSKSMVAKLLKLVFGKYISKVPVAMIMGRRGNADNATPHLADKKGVRALFVEEPPKGQSNVSVVKEMSGNDDIISRALFKMPIIFAPQWKLFVWTNHLLEAPAEEKAYWNRQKVVEHESLYSFDAPASVEEQFAKKTFPRDPAFDRKLVAMAEPALWCFFEWYKIFKREGLIPPKRVLHATNLAKLKNDVYLQYIQSSLQQGTQHDLMAVQTMFADFEAWHKANYHNRPMPIRSDFEDEMSKPGHVGNKPIDGFWVGIKLKNIVTQLPPAMGVPLGNGGILQMMPAQGIAAH